MAERQHSVPDWLLERLVAGDLPEETARELRSRLQAQSELGRIERLEASNRAILAAHPSASVVDEVRRRSRAASPVVSKRRASRSVFTFPALALSGTAALVLVLTLLPSSGVDPGRAEGSDPASAAAGERVTAKGLAPQLAVYKRTASGVERLGRGDRVRAGDMLQLAYVAAGASYGVVASVDGEGTVTLHLPERGGVAARLVEAGETALPHAFELDGAAGFEHFVLVTSDAPFPTGTVELGLSKKGNSWPEALKVTDLLLEKKP